MRSNPRDTHLPSLVPKDWSRARVHQVRFSTCREEVWQNRVALESMRDSYRRSLVQRQRGLGQEGLGVNSGNVWSQTRAEICMLAETGIHKSIRSGMGPVVTGVRGRDCLTCLC